MNNATVEKLTLVRFLKLFLQTLQLISSSEEQVA